MGEYEEKMSPWLNSCCPNRRTVIVGAGYIAVEMAGILSTLGSKTSLIIRQTGVRNTSPQLSLNTKCLKSYLQCAATQ